MIPLFAVLTIKPETLDKLPNFKRRLCWFIENRADLTTDVTYMRTPGMSERRLLAVAHPERLKRILRVMFAENEFLSDYGIRSLSRVDAENPYTFDGDGFMNEIENSETENRPAGSCVMVIFGATGDLTKRKLLPALYNLARQDYLPEEFAIVGVGRRQMSDEEFRAKVGDDLREYVAGEIEPEKIEWFQERGYTAETFSHLTCVSARRRAARRRLTANLRR